MTVNTEHHLPALLPGQDMLFLSAEKPNAYIASTFIAPAAESRSYLVKHQGCKYCNTRHNIHALNYTANVPITRPQMHKEPTQFTLFPGPSAHTNDNNLTNDQYLARMAAINGHTLQTTWEPNPPATDDLAVAFPGIKTPYIP